MVYDPLDEAPARGAADLRERLKQLHAGGGLDTAPALVEARVRFSTVLSSALANAAFVQECAPERLELKRTLLLEGRSHIE